MYLDDIQLIYLQEVLDALEYDKQNRLKEVLKQEILIRIEGEILYRERVRLEGDLRD